MKTNNDGRAKNGYLYLLVSALAFWGTVTKYIRNNFKEMID